MSAPLTPAMLAADAVLALRAIRSELVALVARVDAAIESVATVADCVSAAPQPAPDSSARIRVFGKRGVIVESAAREHGVPVAHVLGPGAPPTRVAAAARKAAILALSADGVLPTDIARILGICFETARKTVRGRKKAA